MWIIIDLFFVSNNFFSKYQNITLIDIKIGNDGGRSEENPVVLGTASSWTDVYKTSMRAAIDKLPDQTSVVANLFSLVTPKASSSPDLFSML